MNERIRMVRENADLSRTAFGEKLGVSGDVINNLERGRVKAKESIIKLICSVYSVDEEWLRTGKGDMSTQKAKADELANTVEQLITGESAEFKRRLITALSSLDDEHWILLEKKLKEIAGEGKACEHLNVPEQEQPEPDYEAEARAEAELFYQQRLLEKQRESQAQSAKESGSA